MGGRGTNCNSKGELKKGPWTREEDLKLLSFIQEHGHGSWRNLPPKAGLKRGGKSCRLRWMNYLRPDIKRGKLSTHEENAIIRLHALLGNRWSTIAAHIPKRTDNEIKNYWNSRLKKRLLRMGIDPTTHKPKNNPASRSAQSSHAAQWEAARLEAEARQGRESSKLPYRLASPPPPPLPRPRHLRAPPCLDVLKVWQSTAIPICFFSSPWNSSLDIESPTSTLSFSSSGATVPAVTAVAANDYGACGVGSRDDTENTFKPCDDQILYPNYCDLTASINQDYEECSMGGEDSNYNDWNELVNMVSTPMMEPLLF